jgi:hypothetical protein
MTLYNMERAMTADDAFLLVWQCRDNKVAPANVAGGQVMSKTIMVLVDFGVLSALNSAHD